MGWPASGALPHHRTQVLHLWHGVLAAGCDLPGRTVGDFRLRAVPGDCRGRSSILRLRLPADGLHRNTDVDRTQDRGRTPGANEARRTTDVCAQVSPQVHQTFAMAACGPVDRSHLRRLFHADQGTARRNRLFRTGALGGFLDIFLHGLPLPDGRFPARAGLQVHVPVCAFPGGDVRPGYPDHQL